MTAITEIIRCYTLPGLYNVEDCRELSFKGWLANKKFKFTQDINPNDFVLDLYEIKDIYTPFAFDINRMATSAFESIHGIEPNKDFPKSVGWLIVRLYYSAYYAAHAILRMFGISCSQFAQNESRIITDVAKLWDHLPETKNASNGYFKCELFTTSAKLSCEKLDNSHADVWQTLYDHLNILATRISEDDTFIKEEKTETIDYIFDLRYGLSCRNKFTKGNWLSMVRNEVNYQHTMGAWFPYNGRIAEHSELYRALPNWKVDFSIDNLNSTKTNNDLQLFVESCVSIVSLCFSLTKDLHNQNPKSFLKFGVSNFLNQAKVKI